MRTIALTNLKGGVGKTTSATQLATALGEKGVRVLLVDADGQGHCSAFLGLKRRGDLSAALLRVRPGSDDPARQFAPVQTFIQRGVRPGVDLLACDPSIALVEATIQQEAMRELRLARRLEEVASEYDICLIDVGPKTDLLSTLALLAADDAVIVTTPSTPDASLRDVVMRLHTLRDEAGRGPAVLGILVTQVDARERLGADILQRIQQAGVRALPLVPRNVEMARATRAGQTIFEAAPKSTSAAAYRAVADELHTHIGGKA